MRSHTVYRTFTTPTRREFVRITEDVEEAVRDSGVREGLVLVSAMHITAGVWVNDDEPGIQEDVLHSGAGWPARPAVVAAAVQRRRR